MNGCDTEGIFVGSFVSRASGRKIPRNAVLGKFLQVVRWLHEVISGCK